MARKERGDLMLLSKIQADPKRFQFRSGDFSAKTVDAIVREGIKLAKFDPIPIITLPGGKVCIGGDGHSRLEAIRRLAKLGRLPAAWLNERAGDWNIPTRIVSESEAKLLSWTANLSRDAFTPCEQAAVYQAMLDDGLDTKEIAEIAQVHESTISKMLRLNGLAADIKAMVGAPATSGGIDIITAQVLACAFVEHKIEKGQQQQLWHCFLKHAQLNFQSAKKFMQRIGAKLGAKTADGMLFEIPANAIAVIHEARKRTEAFRMTRTALIFLKRAHADGALSDYPDLVRLIDGPLDGILAAVAERVTEDGEMLADVVAAPKFFKPIPKDAIDRKIERQYDPKATAEFSFSR